MRLLSAVLGFVLRKAGAFIALVLSLFVVALLMAAVVPQVKKAVADRDRLEAVTAKRDALESDVERMRSTYDAAVGDAIDAKRSEVEAAVEEAGRRVASKQEEVSRLRDDREDVCGFWKQLPENVSPFGPNPCEAADAALEKADNALDVLEEHLGESTQDAEVLDDPALTDEQKLDQTGADAVQPELAQDIGSTESDLAETKAEESRLHEAEKSWAGWIVSYWHQSWKWLVGIAILVLAAKPLARTIGYFVLMPLATKASKDFRLAVDVETSATVHTGAAVRSLPIQLAPDEELSARSEHVRPVKGKGRSRILYDWSAPFISFAAGLHGLTRIVGDEEGVEVTLAAPDDPTAYLMRIDFVDHPGLTMHPTHVVGVMGGPELTTRWRWGLHSLVTWQVRYILFGGTGSLIVQGCGDVQADVPGDRPKKIEQTLMMGFDSRLTVGFNRTEAFWPYLLGRTPLVDDELIGQHPFFWQKSTTTGTGSPLAKVFSSFFSGLGKLLGF